MRLFDHIANEILREIEVRRGVKNLPEELKSLFNNKSFQGVTGVTRAIQERQLVTDLGKGGLPIDKQPLPFDRLIQKIKHRSGQFIRRRDLVNFRIQENNHILLIATDNSGGRPEGIYEFDVGEFCETCRSVVRYFN